MSHELDHMTKAAAWAAGFGFRLLWAGPKPLLGRHQWPGPNRLGLARLTALGWARQITIWEREPRRRDEEKKLGHWVRFCFYLLNLLTNNYTTCSTSLDATTTWRQCHVTTYGRNHHRYAHRLGCTVAPLAHTVTHHFDASHDNGHHITTALCTPPSRRYQLPFQHNDVTPTWQPCHFALHHLNAKSMTKWSDDSWHHFHSYSSFFFIHYCN